MGNKAKAALGAVVIAGLNIASAAQAACWSPAAADAAKVREFETMLMVSALRCRNTGVNFLPDYNRFVKNSRASLTQVNNTLRSHFGGAKAGLNRYDRYVTSIANKYGAGNDGMDCRDMREATRDAIDAKGSTVKLAALADRTGAQPELPGGVCRAVASRGR